MSRPDFNRTEGAGDKRKSSGKESRVVLRRRPYPIDKSDLELGGSELHPFRDSVEQERVRACSGPDYASEEEGVRRSI